MTFPVEIWLRGDNHATSDTLPLTRDPQAWTDGDVAVVLSQMLRALDRARDPQAAADRPIALRGFSWIVNPFQEGGVVIAIEFQAGAAVAGPFQIDRLELEHMVTRVMTHGQTRPGVQ